MKKSAISVTFAQHVTREDLIKSLDQILDSYGCPGCGLNGWGVYLLGDPDPIFTQLRREFINEKNNPVINVEHFQMPFNQNFGAEFNRG